MTAPSIRTGFSTCPNDTFMFHGLVSGEIQAPFRVEPVMEDISALNARAAGPEDGRLPVTKLSVSALAHLTTDYAALGSGAALGRGCGPLVVRRPGGPPGLADLRGARVAIPGLRTTAYLLLRIFGPTGIEVTPMRFDQIMPAVERGEQDAGLIIHESRFTYPDHGLEAVADLGEVWEADTGLPLPLGIIAARRSLDAELIAAFEVGLRESVVLALAHPDRSRPWIREHAQEMSDSVCDEHIALYVNQYSIDLGEEGRRAVEELLERARARGLVPGDSPSPWR